MLLWVVREWAPLSFLDEDCNRKFEWMRGGWAPCVKKWKRATMWILLVFSRVCVYLNIMLQVRLCELGFLFGKSVVPLRISRGYLLLDRELWIGCFVAVFVGGSLLFCWLWIVFMRALFLFFLLCVRLPARYLFLVMLLLVWLLSFDSLGVSPTGDFVFWMGKLSEYVYW